jgi:hypothetical protein
MAVDVDDGTLPLDNSGSSPASEGAGEFRALKTKVKNLYLNSGIDATITKLIDTNNRGLNVNISDGSVVDLYGGKQSITRTANAAAKATYGIWAQAVLNNSINVGAGIVQGAVSVAQTGTGCTFGFLIGFGTTLYQQTHNANASIFGYLLVYANRLTAVSAAPGGLGSNQYNRGAVGIYIDSFARSSSGEFCGWRTGIKFSATSMDADVDGKGYCIDMSLLAYQGTFDPLTAYRCKGAIRLNNFLAIVWDSVEWIRTYFDSNSGRWTLENNGVKRFEIDVATGQVYKNGVLQY